jgi:Putative addiction module component
MFCSRRKAMSARALALEKRARKLPATERERLAERLLVQMKHEPLTAVDEAWIAETEKRFAAWKRKAIRAVAAPTALRKIRMELCH